VLPGGCLARFVQPSPPLAGFPEITAGQADPNRAGFGIRISIPRARVGGRLLTAPRGADETVPLPPQPGREIASSRQVEPTVRAKPCAVTSPALSEYFRVLTTIAFMSSKVHPARFRAAPRPNAPSDRDPPRIVEAWSSAAASGLLCLVAISSRSRMLADVSLVPGEPLALSRFPEKVGPTSSINQRRSSRGTTRRSAGSVGQALPGHRKISVAEV
jgi:hypothetical protein